MAIMSFLPHAAVFAFSAVILMGCDVPPDPAAPPAGPTTCNLVGCGDLVSVTFVDLLADHGGALPFTVELKMDGQIVSTTEVSLGTTPGGGCWQTEGGVACCSSSPPADEFECIPEVNGDLRMRLHVGPEGAFDHAVHAVGATVWGADGAVLLEDESVAVLHMHQPNGPMCEPTCFQGGVQLPEEAE